MPAATSTPPGTTACARTIPQGGLRLVLADPVNLRAVLGVQHTLTGATSRQDKQDQSKQHQTANLGYMASYAMAM